MRTGRFCRPGVVGRLKIDPLGYCPAVVNNASARRHFAFALEARFRANYLVAQSRESLDRSERLMGETYQLLARNWQRNADRRAAAALPHDEGSEQAL
jgi:hypothetical protein